MLAQVLSAGFWHAAARADDRPEAGDLGRLLGYTILCDCVVGDPDWLMSVYFAIIENAYDRDLAEAMSGHMRVVLNSGYDNEMSICARVCGMDITQDLRELVAGIDGTVESPEFQQFMGTEAGGTTTSDALPEIPPSQFCVWRPNSPKCAL